MNKHKSEAIVYNIKSIFGIKKHRYLDSKETINYLLLYQKSLIRWGDGETAISLGNSIWFQNADKELSCQLNEIMKSYAEQPSQYLLAAPNNFLKASMLSLFKLKKVRTWFFTRFIFEKAFKKSVVFGDAFIFRPLSSLKNDDIEKLWTGHNVIMVHPKKQVFQDFSKRYPNIKSSFVAVDEENAYSHISITMEDIERTMRDNGFGMNDTRILVTAGPTAKVIVYNLSKMGYTAYDMGHYFNWKFYRISNTKGI